MKMQALQSEFSSKKTGGKSNGVSNSLDSISEIGSLVSKASGVSVNDYF